jgi:hypothetical protein
MEGRRLFIGITVGRGEKNGDSELLLSKNKEMEATSVLI